MPLLVLATRSPRRIGILRSIGARFVVIEPRASELSTGDPHKLVVENARRKAYSVIDRAPKGSVVVSADTAVISHDGRLFGKPRSIDEQAAFLRSMRCRWHSVLTGVYIVDLAEGGEEWFIEETRVKMRCFSERELRLYLASMEGLGKAGGYAIQGLGALLIERIDGDYYNVVGLPLARLYLYLLRHGIDILSEGVYSRIGRRPG